MTVSVESSIFDPVGLGTHQLFHRDFILESCCTTDIGVCNFRDEKCSVISGIRNVVDNDISISVQTLNTLRKFNVNDSSCSYTVSTFDTINTNGTTNWTNNSKLKSILDISTFTPDNLNTTSTTRSIVNNLIFYNTCQASVRSVVYVKKSSLILTSFLPSPIFKCSWSMVCRKCRFEFICTIIFITCPICICI